MTPELFQQYLEGLCNSAEQDQVEHWLHACADEELDDLLLPRWTNNKTIMPQERSLALWDELQSAIGAQRPAGQVIGMKWYARAAVLLILIAGWWMYKKGSTAPVTMGAVQPVYHQHINDTVNIINNGSHKKEIQLSDGSVVTLSAHSRLQYKKDFTGNQRDVYLDGKAVFRVAKDKHRPFTVYSGAISTTALGTVFTVNTLVDKKHISVKLFEGKVVVRHQQSKKETFLLPGQELTYDITNHTSAIKKPAKPIPAVAPPSLQPKEITFDNAPLPEVFDKLQEQYAAVIAYNKADIHNMYFTGTISVKDALPLVLKVITQMNGLELKEQAKGFIVRPTSH
jgi:ferric-dicitrate binding protein FerR (iron transport regulator)